MQQYASEQADLDPDDQQLWPNDRQFGGEVMRIVVQDLLVYRLASSFQEQINGCANGITLHRLAPSGTGKKF